MASALLERSASRPVVTLLGPRQSGKTTLARQAFPRSQYVNLEHPTVREMALSDPETFLARHRPPVIFDEIQRCPELLSFIQVAVDQQNRNGEYILTGSQQLHLSRGVSQSLAGRTALLELLPLDIREVQSVSGADLSLSRALFQGGYPRLFSERLAPETWLPDYIETYLERDVRELVQVRDFVAFRTTLRLLAGRTSQELILSRVAADAGVSVDTVRGWVSVLEATFALFRVPPFFRNWRKRLVKAPKLHFIDSGIVCSLLGVTDANMLDTYPLRGAIFESWVAAELRKHFANRGERVTMSHFRASPGFEVDIILERGSRIDAIEIKSGRAVNDDAIHALHAFEELAKSDPTITDVRKIVVYGGDEQYRRSGVNLVPWRQMQEFEW